MYLKINKRKLAIGITKDFYRILERVIFVTLIVCRKLVLQATDNPFRSEQSHEQATEN